MRPGRVTAGWLAVWLLLGPGVAKPGRPALEAAQPGSPTLDKIAQPGSLAGPGVTKSGGPALDDVVAGLEDTYARISDLRAEFSQSAFNKSLGQTIKAEGTVYLKRGGKMRWEYQTPSPQQIVSDGKFLWVYTPELNQVNVGEAPRALAGPAGSFLAGLGRLREEFTIRFLNPLKVDDVGNPILDLTPKVPTPFLTRLVLSVDSGEHLVRKAVLYDQFENTVTMSFTKITVNAGLADGLFAFTPPKGTAVVPLEFSR